MPAESSRSVGASFHRGEAARVEISRLSASDVPRLETVTSSWLAERREPWRIRHRTVATDDAQVRVDQFFADELADWRDIESAVGR